MFDVPVVVATEQLAAEDVRVPLAEDDVDAGLRCVVGDGVFDVVANDLTDVNRHAEPIGEHGSLALEGLVGGGAFGRRARQRDLIGHLLEPDRADPVAALGRDVAGDPEQCRLAVRVGVRTERHQHAPAPAVGEQRSDAFERVRVGCPPDRVKRGSLAFGSRSAVEAIPDHAGDDDPDRTGKRERPHLREQEEPTARSEQLDPRIARRGVGGIVPLQPALAEGDPPR